MTPQLRAFTIPSFFIMNTSAPAPSGCCIASYSSFQRQLRSLAPLHTWAGMPVRGWCFHSTLCWSLPLYLAHFNKTICLPTVFPHQYTNIHPLLCRQVARSLCHWAALLSNQSQQTHTTLVSHPHTDSFPQFPRPTGTIALPMAKPKLGDYLESSGFCLLTQPKPINPTSKIP